MPGKFSHHRLKSKPLVRDPGMHQDTCVPCVPWCMSGSLTLLAGKTFPTFPAHSQPASLHIWQEAHVIFLVTKGPDATCRFGRHTNTYLRCIPFLHSQPCDTLSRRSPFLWYYSRLEEKCCTEGLPYIVICISFTQHVTYIVSLLRYTACGPILSHDVIRAHVPILRLSWYMLEIHNLVWVICIAICTKVQLKMYVFY